MHDVQARGLPMTRGPGREAPSEQQGASGVDKDALQRILTELSEARFSASSGQGTVTTTVDGAGKLVELEIDPYLDAGKLSRLSSLLLQSINDARRAAATHSEDQLETLFGGKDVLADQLRQTVPWLGSRRGEE